MRAESGSLLRIYQVCLFYVMLLWLGAMLLLGNIACLSLILTPKAFRAPLVQGFISAVFRLFLCGASACGLMRLDLSALDALNGKRQMILVANHPSMIDVFLIISRLRRSICLMKASIGGNVFFGVGSYLAGYVSNHQTDLMLRTAALSVAQGNLLLVFPEGTRTTRQPINEVKSGFALIAKRAHASLQVLLIVTNSAYLSKGWPLFRPPQFPLVYKVSLGPAWTPAGTTTQTAQRLQTFFEQAISSSIDPGVAV